MKLILENWKKYLNESKQLPNLLYHGATEVFDKFDRTFDFYDERFTE